jgi:F0F1-type ATP synthase membrane subunit b/b'
MKTGSQPMNDRARQLLTLVEQARDQRCSELLEAARAQAQRLVKQAWQNARAGLHREVEQARGQFRRQRAIEQAAQDADRRRAQQTADRQLLDAAWQQLHAVLGRRWHTTASRRVWIDALIEQASARLVERQWRIEHPADWPEPERLALEQQLAGGPGPAPVFVADPALLAGLRIRAGDTVVDGSSEGLLRDRRRIESRLLAVVRGMGTDHD